MGVHMILQKNQMVNGILVAKREDVGTIAYNEVTSIDFWYEVILIIPWGLLGLRNHFFTNLWMIKSLRVFYLFKFINSSFVDFYIKGFFDKLE
jgi:hypothetical protein